MLALIVTGALTLCTALYALMRYRLSYWRRRKVPFATPSAPFGNFGATVSGKRNMSQIIDDIYHEHRDERYVGTYFMMTPLLQVNDPDILQHVFIKEFQDFNGRGTHGDTKRDALAGHLFLLGGQAWRNLRVKLSPTFSSGKIKYMFGTISECAANLREHVAASMRAGGGAYDEDLRELAACFSTDVITSIGFGIECNSIRDRDSEFRKMGRAIFAPTFNVNIRGMLMFFGGRTLERTGIRSVTGPVHDFFVRVVGEMVAYREQNKVDRADMLNLLMKLKNDGYIPSDATEAQRVHETTSDGKERLTLQQVTANVYAMFLAGFETTSTTTSFTLLELAKHPDILDKVIEEVDAVLAKHGGQLTYDALMQMPFTDMVVQETMRHYPPLPFLTREVMVRRTLPLTDLTLEKGTVLLIPVQSLHMDPKYWPHPERYDPLRFTEEAKKSRPSCVYMPFGDGPRLCIGMRLGLVQVKAALASILSLATVTLAPGMPHTPRMSPRTVVPTPMDGIRLTMTARSRTLLSAS